MPAWRLAVAGSSFTIRCARGHGVRAFGGGKGSPIRRKRIKPGIAETSAQR